MIIVSYPNIGEYERIVYNFLDKIIDKSKCKILRPEKNNRKILELGEENSPTNVCTPFKYTLGSMINSLNKGANVIIQIGGGCRFGYYAQIQEKILKKDMGYDFDFINLYNGNKLEFFKAVKKAKILNSNLKVQSLLKEIYFIVKLLRFSDNIITYIRDNECYIDDKEHL